KSREEVVEALRQLDPSFLEAAVRRLAHRTGPAGARRLAAAADQLADALPTDRESLYRFTVRETGLKIPRNAVCNGHCAPFDFFADIILEEGDADKLGVGNRGSGKTQIMGAAHAVNARCKPKWTGCTVGAIEAQAQRCANFFHEIL